MKRIKHSVYILVAMLMVVGLMLSCAPKPEVLTPPPEPIVLKGVTFLPTNFSVADAFRMLVDRVNERAEGELVIDFVGGPEAIGMFEQATAVKEGAVDIVFLPASFFRGLVPGVGAFTLSRLTPQEERESGAYDFAREELFKPAGLFYLGRAVSREEPAFYVAINKRIENPREDFKGLKMTGPPHMVSFYSALGATHLSLAHGEFYTALETGMIVAYADPLSSIVTASLHEQLKYVIDHPLYRSDVLHIVNLDSWNRLPKHLQDLMIEVQIEVERDFGPVWDLEIEEARQTMLDAGLEFYKFSPADAEWYIETAYQSTWDAEIKEWPEVGPRLREQFSK